MPNVQVALTSRYDFLSVYSLHNFDLYKIKDLDDNVVGAYLKSIGAKYYKGLANVLNNPMMLTIYADNNVTKKQLGKIHPFAFRTGNKDSVKTDILYDFLLCQLAKLHISGEDVEIPKTAAALFYVAPYVACRVEKEGQFQVERTALKQLIREGVGRFGEALKELVSQDFARMWDIYRLKADVDAYRADDYVDVLAYRYHMFIEEEGKYAFRHQHFRDFFSAVHIVNAIYCESAIAQTPKAPAELSERVFSYGLCDMIGEYLNEHKNKERITHKTVLHDVIDSLRDKEHDQSDYALNNIIGIWRRARNDGIIGEDLSGIDFRHISLNGIHFSRGNVATSFERGKFDEHSLMPINHTSAINCICLSPDGKHIASGSTDKTIKIWDAVSFELIKTIEGHKRSINAIAYSPDGKYIASGSNDYTIKIWDAVSFEVVNTIKGYDDFVSVITHALTYSPGGKYIVSGSDNGTIKIWDAVSFELVKTIGEHKRPINAIAYSPDGKYIVSGSDNGTIKIWSTVTFGLVKAIRVHESSASAIAYSPDGEHIVSGYRDNAIKILNAVSFEVVNTIEGHDDWIRALAYSPDGATLTCSIRNSVVFHHAQTFEHIQTVQFPSGINTFGCSFFGAQFDSDTLEQTVRRYGGIVFDTHLRGIYSPHLKSIPTRDILSPWHTTQDTDYG